MIIGASIRFKLHSFRPFKKHVTEVQSYRPRVSNRVRAHVKVIRLL